MTDPAPPADPDGCASSAHWSDYNAGQHGRAVRPLCAHLLEVAGSGRGRRAVDLGCGAGIETRALLEAGWVTLALDADEASLRRLEAAVPEPLRPALTVAVADLEDLVGLPPADLVHAGYALPWVRPERFASTWEAVRGALRPGAWVAVDLFGDRDSWAGRADVTCHSASAARGLFDGLDLVRFDVEDEDGEAFGGPKHWHVFHVVARRRG